MAPPPTLIVHPGLPKCGSSSIQSVLNEHRHELYRLGIGLIGSEYFKSSKGNDDTFTGASTIIADLIYDRATPAEVGAQLRRAIDAHRRRGVGTILVSAENLTGFDDRQQMLLRDMLACLPRDLNVLVPVYLRPQDQLIEAFWKQWNGKIHDGGFMDYLLRELDRPTFDLAWHLDFWTGLGHPSLAVRPRTLDPGDIQGGNLWTDFAISCGLPDPTRTLSATDPWVNMSPPRDWIDCAFEAREVAFEHEFDNRLFDYLERVLERSDPKRYRNHRFLSPPLVSHVQAHYAPSNRRVVETYFESRASVAAYLGCYDTGEVVPSHDPRAFGRELLPSNIESGFRQIVLLSLIRLEEQVTAGFDRLERENARLGTEILMLTAENQRLQPGVKRRGWNKAPLRTLRKTLKQSIRRFSER